MRSSAGEVERVDRKEGSDKGNQHGTTNKVVRWGHVLKLPEMEVVNDMWAGSVVSRQSLDLESPPAIIHVASGLSGAQLLRVV